MGGAAPTFNPADRQDSDYAGNIRQSSQNALDATKNYGTVFGQQQALAQQLQAQANGTAPSIANEQLKQGLAQNNARTFGLAASTLGTNPGLLQRRALMANSEANQAASGQAAMNRLAERNAAQGQLGSLYGTEGGQAIYNQMANTQQAGTFGGLQENQNQGRATNQHSSDALNEDVWKTQSQNAKDLEAAGINGVATLGAGAVGLAKAPGAAHGGRIGALSRYADGGVIDPAKMASDAHDVIDYPHDSFTSAIQRLVANNRVDQRLLDGSAQNRRWPMPHEYQSAVDAEDKNLSAMRASKMGPPRPMANGGGIARPMLSLLRGGNVPGRAQYPGDDKRNDVVPAVLSKEEVVLPRSVTLSPNAPEMAKRFMSAVRESDGGRVKSPASQDTGPTPSAYAKYRAVSRRVQADLKALDKLMGPKGRK